jgi:hypothetical protein
MQNPPSSGSAIARTVRNRRGRPSRSWSEFTKSAMETQGRLKIFHDKGDSGQPVERNFCPECGSPIFSDVAAMPGITFIKAGTLDDTSWLDPKMHVYCDSKEHWTPIPEGSQKIRENACVAFSDGVTSSQAFAQTRCAWGALRASRSEAGVPEG